MTVLTRMTVSHLSGVIGTEQLLTCKLGGQKRTHSAKLPSAHPFQAFAQNKYFRFFPTTKPLATNKFHTNQNVTKLTLQQCRISKKIFSQREG